MTSLTVRPLNPVFWIGIPIVLCAIASLVFALPFSLFGLRLPEPVFAFAPAFAWAIIRPSVLPPFGLLLLGLFTDILWGGPIGLWPLCLMSVYAPVLLGRAFLSGLGFWGLWSWYLAVSGVAMVIGWVLVSLQAGVAPNLIGFGCQFLVTGALFPFGFRLIEQYEDADVRFR